MNPSLAEAVGRCCDLGTVAVTRETIRTYADSVGDRETAAGPCVEAPVTFALMLRGAPTPAVELPESSFTVHAGHDITVFQPLRAPGEYRIRARVTDVFEKSGRSGPLTVITRLATIETPRGETAVEISDDQIVRPRPPTAPASSRHAATPRGPICRSMSLGEDEGSVDVEIGAAIGPEIRASPDPEQVRLWSRIQRVREGLFTDPGAARRLGYPDVIVPGPMQSALLEQMLLRRLRGWRIRRLGTTFRVSVIAGETITLGGVVTEWHAEPGGERIVCDLVLENGDGERASTGTAHLRHETSASRPQAPS
jgi:acyl dehydratase